MCNARADGLIDVKSLILKEIISSLMERVWETLFYISEKWVTVFHRAGCIRPGPDSAECWAEPGRGETLAPCQEADPGWVGYRRKQILGFVS